MDAACVRDSVLVRLIRFVVTVSARDPHGGRGRFGRRLTVGQGGTDGAAETHRHTGRVGGRVGGKGSEVRDRVVARTTVDSHGHRVARAGEPIRLTRTEFNLLATLAQHPGQTFTRAQLLDRLHGVAYDGYDRSIDAHIKNLRRKLEADPIEPRYVLTVYGVGYKFTDEV